MPRAKKTTSAPANATEPVAKAVVSVNPDPANGGVKASSTLKASSPSKASGSVKSNGDLEAAIRARAYELYEQRGRIDGLAQEDWVRAEREVTMHQGKRTA